VDSDNSVYVHVCTWRCWQRHGVKAALAEEKKPCFVNLDKYGLWMHFDGPVGWAPRNFLRHLHTPCGLHSTTAVS